MTADNEDQLHDNEDPRRVALAVFDVEDPEPLTVIMQEASAMVLRVSNFTGERLKVTLAYRATSTPSDDPILVDDLEATK